MQAQSRPSLPELTTRSRGQVIDTVWASSTKVALMRRRVQDKNFSNKVMIRFLKKPEKNAYYMEAFTFIAKSINKPVPAVLGDS